MGNPEAGGIKIVCYFEGKKDLERHISLSESSSVTFTKGDLSYEYTCGTSCIDLIDNIIRRVIEDLSGAFDLGVASVDDVSSISSLKPEKVEEGSTGHSSTSSSSTTSSSVMNEKRPILIGGASSLKGLDSRNEAEKSIKAFKEILKGSKFKMVIIDSSGLSRITPPGKTMSDCKFEDLSSFDDDKVKHTRHKAEHGRN
jgi:C4-type Zn-finger protein